MTAKLEQLLKTYSKLQRESLKVVVQIEDEEPRFKSLETKDDGWTLWMHLHQNQYVTEAEVIGIAREIFKDNDLTL